MKKQAMVVGMTLALLCGTVNAQGTKNVAYASTQNVLVNGTAIEFQAYALKDADGNDTNYVKLRDVAQALSGTAAQFEVGWDGAVNIAPGKTYTPNGSEMKTPFTGNRAYKISDAETRVNGTAVKMDAIVLTDDEGGGFTYYKLRDLGKALGFDVNWSAEKGITIDVATSAGGGENVFRNEANFGETAGSVTINPRYVYWEGDTLVAQCFVINGLDVPIYNIALKELAFADKNEKIFANAGFGTLNGASVGAHSYIVWTFSFLPDTVTNSGADLSHLYWRSSVSYSHGQTLQDQMLQQQINDQNLLLQQQMLMGMM